MSTRRLTYVEDVIALFEADIADSKNAMKTAYLGEREILRSEINGVRAAIHILKRHASHGGTVDAVPMDALEAWLYEIAMNNTDNTLGGACEEIIRRLDGLRAFARERESA